MSIVKKTFISLAIILISSFLGILFVELFLQCIKEDDGWDKTREANILRNFEFEYIVKDLYESDNSVVKYSRNKYGLRDSCTNTSEITILSIGGSTTDQRYISLEDTYQETIKSRLKKNNPNFGCVTNAGIDGHTTTGHIFSFENWFPLIPNLKPKYILFFVGVNDANFNRAFGPKSNDINHLRPREDGLKKFEIVKRLLPIYSYIKQSMDNSAPVYARHKPSMYTPDSYTEVILNENTKSLSIENAKNFKVRFEKLLKYTEEIGAEPICVTQPHRFVIEKEGVRYGIPKVFEEFSGLDYDYSIQKLNSIIKNLCGANFIDLYSHNFKDEHFYDGIHTTPIGSKLIGNMIADFLINQY